MNRTLRTACLLTAALLAGRGTTQDAAPGIDYAGGRFEVRGLPAATLPGLADAARRDAALRVSVDGETRLLGTSGVTAGVLWFRPRFPVAPDVPHTVTFAPPTGPPLSRTITLPKPAAPPTAVDAVFPSGETVPENVLRFYVRFSAPVRRGEAYRRVRLLGPDGKPVDLPFLELDEELWDPTGTRLTLLIDPGRIKRGVKPLVDLGPVFVAGKAYTLEIDAAWPDAHGRPLAAGLRKRYAATPAVRERIDPTAWTLAAPANPAVPLVVRFPRPLDRGLLERSLAVVDASGASLAGTGTVEPGETGWRFAPGKPWVPGGYELRVGPDLEDVAGNRSDRVFDAAEGAAPLARPTLSRRFTVGPR